MTQAVNPTVSRRRPRVVIAGGGVAAVEALIALRDLLDGFVEIHLVAPGKDFVYRPLSVAEPFGLAEPRRFALPKIAADHGAELHVGLLESVSHDQALVKVSGGATLTYDALLVAVGARPRDWLAGAVHFGGPEDVADLGAIVTPETHALDVFGPAAARHVRDLCANRGIELRTATQARSFGNGQLKLEPGGVIAADRVVALPELE